MRRFRLSPTLASPLLLGILFAASPLLADQAILFADRDATLYEDQAGATANGAGPRLYAGETVREGLRRALLHFDVASALPPGSTIQSVVLSLEVDQIPIGPVVSRDFFLHRVTSDWGEGSSNAGLPGGAGTAAATDDATWLHTFYASTFWATPGGDFAATASASQAVSGLGSYEWGSTAGLVADVQSWLDAPADNHGWLLLGEEQGSTSARRFLSREATGNVPRLVIEFQPPAAAIPTLGDVARAIFLLLLAGAALLLLRRRPATA